MHFLLRKEIPTSFVPGTKRSLASLAKEKMVSEPDLSRFVRFSTLDRIFALDPDDPKLIVHTPASKALHDPSGLRACIGQLCEEVWPAASRTVNAIEKWDRKCCDNHTNFETDNHICELAAIGEDGDPSHTGWNLANNTEQPLYSFLSHDERRGKQFAESMSFFHAQPGLGHEILAHGFDWEKKAGEDGLVVDVGGNQGELSIAVAKRHPRIRFIVQDLEEVITSRDGNRRTSELRLSGLDVRFMVHDFFTEQPVKSADVYILR